ncbi:class I SAM-dependent methyltransferase [Aurantiacibacter gilvus]|uniref:Methyltransferase domain-containing protein n=1 Tax=Aurantiacibacter gilvus TaxID=3139141 RepID=A0ABU9IDJ6_9SPHN
MSGSHPNEAWNTFWERTGGRSGGGCLPSGWQGIADMQRRVWQSFSRALPGGASLLDLATGDGVVLAQILEKRRDLTLIGVDRATTLPAPPKGITLKGGVGMEQLPFPDSHFAAVTSQFGFEYGDIEQIAPEIARVLQPGGKLGLITHRLKGPIVAHNRKRREQISWAIDEQKLPEIARNSLALREAGIRDVPQALAEAPAKGVAAHGEGSAAWEIAEAIRQTLEMGRNDAPERVAGIIADIEAQAANELGRIASLENAAATASDADRVIDVLEAAGLKFREEAMLTDGRSADPFADYRTYTLTG